MDSDLSESLAALRAAFQKRRIPVSFGKADAELVQSLRQTLKLPRRYREFLLESDPIAAESRTPSESIRLLPALELLDEQKGFALTESGERCDKPLAHGWRSSWIIIAHSTVLGDPYFLDTARLDAEGDCAVFTAMSGTEHWKPRLCASSFALFLRIVAVGLELGQGFAADADSEDEAVFRESLGPRIREYDPAALKAGHWT